MTAPRSRTPYQGAALVPAVARRTRFIFGLGTPCDRAGRRNEIGCLLFQPTGSTMIKSWLEAYWVAGAVFMGLALLLLAPVGFAGEGLALLLIFLASPVYMLHQVEEHTGDRFRTYINGTVFGGVQALSVSDVLWINLPGVWGLNLAALYAAHFIDVGWGVAAGYLILINGIAHIAMAARFRGYNPGLATGALVFVPFGLASILLVPATSARERSRFRDRARNPCRHSHTGQFECGGGTSIGTRANVAGRGLTALVSPPRVSG